MSDPKKYDSPRLCRHGEHVHLVGRGNLTETGDFDLGYDWLPFSAQRLAYIAAYWTKPKRCALWEIDPASLAVTHVLDLPSRGDTCFAEALPLDDDQYLVGENIMAERTARVASAPTASRRRCAAAMAPTTARRLPSSTRPASPR